MKIIIKDNFISRVVDLGAAKGMSLLNQMTYESHKDMNTPKSLYYGSVHLDKIKKVRYKIGNLYISLHRFNLSFNEVIIPKEVDGFDKIKEMVYQKTSYGELCVILAFT